MGWFKSDSDLVTFSAEEIGALMLLVGSAEDLYSDNWPPHLKSVYYKVKAMTTVNKVDGKINVKTKDFEIVE